MNKLTKIKYLFIKPQIANLPKYLALFGLIHTVVLPISALSSENEAIHLGKPALLALAEIRPLPSLLPDTEKDSCQLMLTQNIALIGQSNPTPYQETLCQNFSNQNSPKAIAIRKKVTVTAYSSTPDQTDSTPFITAMGTLARDGVVAANFLKFGTRVRLPEMYGDKIFVVEDRMARWNGHKLDIWMPNRNQALDFGVKRLTLEILE